MPKMPWTRIIGSQRRVNLAEAGMKLVGRPQPGTVLLEDLVDGHKELWYANNHHAGYTIQVGRWGYEFVQDFNPR